MNTDASSPNRNDLLHLLREAHASGEGMERRLRHLLAQDSHAAGGQAMQTLLAQTIEQQGLLSAAVSRIEDTQASTLPGSPDTSASPAHVNPGAANAQDTHALLDLREDMLREVELYAELIETAESTGFFETKFVCEGILSRKSATIEWLATQQQPDR
ncbi:MULTISPECIES: hypothetical protein [unclassified Burkholderia]|uniref:hypothetical protein n=1 Tax=unclassified Burkholderia TaxID=2613784 RepID=UPI001422BA58|nr:MULTISPECIES: hypothetical protein [unclassified Burkholderia]NIE82587.1 hypothetical protein [Burkholderia sp. Tr-860]NIF61971.1 hypothetical protein [Burkholderia sp. Cy-647]NIF95608.1 hypothetical protein [Burkholderia sp. Ax-1720]